MYCEDKTIAVDDATERQGNMQPRSNHRPSARSSPTRQADAQSTNAAASAETPNTSIVPGSNLPLAQDVLVGEGKYHAVSEGSIGPSGLSTVGDAGAGAGVVMTKVPHWTSLPE